MPSFIPAAMRRLILSCVESGTGIEGMEGAPRFRYTPAAQLAGQEVPHHARTYTGGTYIAKPLHRGPPSSRGSVKGTVAKGFPKLKNWTVPSYSLAPNYNVPMAGDDAALTNARLSWHHGDPGLLRKYLAKQAGARRAEARIEARLFA